MEDSHMSDVAVEELSTKIVEPHQEKQSGLRTKKRLLYIMSFQMVAMAMTGPVLSFPSVILPDVLANNSTLYGTFLTFNDTQKDLMDDFVITVPLFPIFPYIIPLAEPAQCLTYLIGSLMNLGALVGVIVGGVGMGILGRRKILAAMGVANLSSWIGIACSVNPAMCLTFRFVGGFGYGSGTLAAVAYVVELSDNDTRGLFTALSAAVLILGQTLCLVPAYWLHFYHVCFINSVLPVIYLLGVAFVLPESPTFLTVKGKEVEARKILLTIRGSEAIVDEEIEAYKQKNDLFKSTNKLQSLLQRDVLIRLAIVFTLFGITVFGGCTPFIAQTARYLHDSGNRSDPAIATVMVHSSQFVAIILVGVFAKKLGRRGAMIVSCSIATLAITLMATFTLYYQRAQSIDTKSEDFNSTTVSTTETIGDNQFVYDNHWIPLVCLMLAQFGTGLGIQNVPIFLSSEYFPTAIRPQAASLCNCFVMVIAFTNLQLYSPMQSGLTQAGILYFYSSISFLGIFFSYFIVQETVGQQVG